MGATLLPLFRGLRFRLMAPVVLIVSLLGAGLYFAVLRAVSDFSERQIRDTLTDLTRQVYDICDRHFTALMNAGLLEDPRAVRIHKARTIGAIEDFMHRQHAEGILWDAVNGTRLIDLLTPSLGSLIPGDPSAWNAALLTVDGGAYYLRHEAFQPWRWHFTLVQDTGRYAPLLQRVRRTYALTLALLLVVVAALLISLNVAVRRPLRRIIAALQNGRPPAYRGTTEFAFLSDTIQQMMHSLEEHSEWLSRLYQVALSDRGEAFFDRVAATVAEGFGGNAVINRIEGPDGVRTVALYRDGQRRESLAYDLKGTPCERIVQSGAPIVCHAGVRGLFPRAEILRTAEAEAYIGYPILNREMRVTGVLQAFGPARRYSPWDRNLFQTIGQMIAAEYAVADREAAAASMREHLFRAQKLESLGVLAGGIAHDFNNLLTALMGNISLARLDGDAGPLATSRLEAAERAAWRAQELTRQLLTFSRGGAPVKSAVTRLDELIRETADFSLRGSSVECLYRFPPDLWTVEIDAGQFSQVIQNLVVNAQEAMPEGGRIRIGAANRTIGAVEGLPLPPGRYVRIEVADSGIGIPQELLDKIFDPYFTTKQRGSGLGLAVCFSIVKRHEGHMAVSSRPGEGTTFEIHIPAGSSRAEAINTAAPRTHRGSGPVLVMDDEQAVRDWLGEALRRMGYSPAFAATGEEAVAAHRQAVEAGRPFVLLIMDLTIAGGMGGRQAIGLIRERQPEAKAIVASGYSNDPVVADFAAYGFSAALPKPFDMAALSRVLDRLLGPAPT
jgi:signal transduction histidine kinase/CheY-like chemotaxis protein